MNITYVVAKLVSEPWNSVSSLVINESIKLFVYKHIICHIFPMFSQSG